MVEQIGALGDERFGLAADRGERRFDRFLAELERRTARSGLEEKASRGKG